MTKSWKKHILIVILYFYYIKYALKLNKCVINMVFGTNYTVDIEH